MRQRTKRALLAAGALVVVGAVWGAVATARAIGGWSAFAARYLCSGVFVAGRSPDAILADDLKGAERLRIDLDRAARSVTVGALGVERQAVYRDGLGCTLVIDATAARLRRAAAPPARATATARADLEWPLGERVSLADLPAGVDARRLSEVVAAAFAGPNAGGTRAVVVVYRGRIVAERHASGFSAATVFPGYSMSKTVTGALVGMLVGRGLLAVDEPAPVGAWHGPGDGRADVTLGQLLHMTSGLAWDGRATDPRSDESAALHGVRDVAAFAAGKPLAAAPASVWKYSSGTSSIVSRVTDDAVARSGEEPVYFPRRALFERIGMDSAVFEIDGAGTHAGGFGVHATARDWARFGLLLLDDGVWRGERILPEGWRAYMATPSAAAPFGAYGAHVWTNARGWKPLLPRDALFAWGFGEQWIAVVPSRDAVIVRLGWNPAIGTWDEERFVADVLQALSPAPLPPPEGRIVFVLRGLRSDDGRMLCFLQPSADTWPDSFVRWTRASIEGGEARCTFAGVEPGTYAISSFHDENADGRLEMLLGFLRREGAATSAPASTRGAPSFADAAFAYPGGDLEVGGEVRYPRLLSPPRAAGS